MAYLPDRRRLEILLPVQLMIGVLIDGTPARQKVESPGYVICMKALGEAGREPIADLSDAKGRRLLNRATRMHAEVRVPFESEDPEVLGLTAFLLIKLLVETGYFSFAEGSAIDRAIELFIGAIEHTVHKPHVVARAERGVREMIEMLQAEDYFGGVEVEQ